MWFGYDARLEDAADAYEAELADEFRRELARSRNDADSEARLATVESEIAMLMDEIDMEREAEERDAWEKFEFDPYDGDWV